MIKKLWFILTKTIVTEAANLTQLFQVALFMLSEIFVVTLIYAIDATKITQELGWQADENFESGIMKTVEWYINKYAKILV